MEEVLNSAVVKELRAEKFGLSLTPIAQQTTISDAPAGGVGDAAGAWDTAAHRDTAIAAINAIIARLKAFGLIA